MGITSKQMDEVLKMAKKKNPLEKFNSDELLQELIKRGNEQADRLYADAEGMECEAQAVQYDINALEDIQL